MISKIEIIQENYKKILEIAKMSNSKTDLCNRLGYYKDGRRLEQLTYLLNKNSFEFNLFSKISLKKNSIFNNENKLKEIVKKVFLILMFVGILMLNVLVVILIL
jgi:hypothetical protein